jgi:hypothetical protein
MLQANLNPPAVRNGQRLQHRDHREHRVPQRKPETPISAVSVTLCASLRVLRVKAFDLLLAGRKQPDAPTREVQRTSEDAIQ